jgi:hypothetical protein
VLRQCLEDIDRMVCSIRELEYTDAPCCHRISDQASRLRILVIENGQKPLLKDSLVSFKTGKASHVHS